MTENDFKFIKPGEVRVRIAPSPTGFLHIGLARTALFNYLFAKQNEGNFILRIEDTDVERSDPSFEKDIMDNLKWLGLEWTEGPDIGGGFGPYRQSERGKIYRKYLEKLVSDNQAYYCFCSEEELEAQRQYQMSIGEAPRYSEKCADLDKATVKKYLAEGKSSVIRFKVPAKKVVFNDLIRGKLEFDSGLIGDMIIAKDLDSPLYNLAVVIDDYEMKISHVIRGEEHISNTPKQIVLQEALGFSYPVYSHLPLILGTDRTKLSKRHGAATVRDYKKEGYLPESLINFMAFLGWNPGNEGKEGKPSSSHFAGAREREIYSLPSLVKEFTLNKVQKGGAVFNIKRLEFLNGFYLRKKSIDRLTDLCLPHLEEAGFNIEKYDKEQIKKIMAIYQERLKKLSEVVELTDFFFKEKLEYDKELLKWKGMEEKDVKNVLDKLEKILFKIKEGDWSKENLENIIMPEAERTGDRGRFLWPLRVALTGKETSAGPFEIAEILGKERTLQRIKEAKEKW